MVTCALKTLTKRQSRHATDEYPVWMSLSHPAPSARMFGLALVLDNEEPLDLMVIDISSLVKKEIGQSTATSERNGTTEVLTTTSSAGTGTQEAVISTADASVLTINDRLQILEDFAWIAIVCETAEDVVDKLACGEIQPAMASAHQIAEDPHGIWLGDCNFTSLSACIPGEDSNPKPEDPAKLTVKIPLKSLDDEVALDELSDDEKYNDIEGDNFEDAKFTEEILPAVSMVAQTAVGAELNGSDDISLLQSPRVSLGRHRPWHHPVYPSMVFAPDKELIPGSKSPESATLKVNSALVKSDDSLQQPLADSEDFIRTEELQRERELEEEDKQSLERSYAYMKAATSKELVLPIQIQLRPHIENRHPCGIFRLFFYDGGANFTTLL